MNENSEPDWLAEMAKGGEALQREAMRIVRAAEQFAANGHARPFAQRITRAVGAAMRELQPPPDVRYGSFSGYGSIAGMAVGTASLTGVGTITAAGSVALAPMRASGQMTVQEPDSIERNIGRIFALVLVAIGTAGLLGVQGPDRVTVDHWLTVLSFALAIAVLVWNALNKQK